MKNKILNTKEVKKIKNFLTEQFGFSGDLPHVFLLSAKEKLYIVNRDIERIDLDKLRISSIGIYFAKLEHDELRLSMEGAQIIGLGATKNVLELDEAQVKEYFKGHDIDMDLEVEGQPFLILKYGGDFFGCGKYKNGKLLNYLSKIHRGNELMLQS